MAVLPLYVICPVLVSLDEAQSVLAVILVGYLEHEGVVLLLRKPHELGELVQGVSDTQVKELPLELLVLILLEIEQEEVLGCPEL